MAQNQDQSPNSFEQPEPEKSGSKKTYNMIIGVLGLLALLLVWSLTSSGTSDKEKEEASQKAAAAAVESRNLMPGEDAGRGLARQAFPKPPEQTNGLAQLPPPPASAKQEDELILVGPPTVDEDDQARRQEEQEERRKKRDAYYAGLGANIMIHRSGNSGQAREPVQATMEPGSRTDQARPMTPDAYDPAADIDKEGFFERADNTQWRSPYSREAGVRYEMKTGTVIPGLMVTGVNSDLPGSIIAQVSQNVYDTATGNELLIPQGARIFGAYDSRVVYGQSRVLVAWNRIVFPDGSSVTLGAMPGADMTGYAGFSDQIDNHYLRIFGSAILMSLITGGMSYAMDTVDNSQDSENANSTSMQDEMASALAAQMGQTTMQLLEKNISIKPTLEIRPGYRFNIVVTKDLLFRGPYVNWR